MPSQQKLQIERGLHQQKHRQFELKGHRNWDGMKESCRTSWPLQTGPQSHSAAKVHYSSRKGKGDPAGTSETGAATAATGPGKPAPPRLRRAALPVQVGKARGRPPGRGPCRGNVTEGCVGRATPVGLQGTVLNQRGLLLSHKI